MRCKAEGHRGRRALSYHWQGRVDDSSALCGKEVTSAQDQRACEADVQGSRVAPAKRLPASKSRSSDHHSRRADKATANGSPSPHIAGRDFRQQLVDNYAQGRASLKDASSVWLLVGRGYGRVRGLVSRSMQKERVSREQRSKGGNWKHTKATSYNAFAQTSFTSATLLAQAHEVPGTPSKLTPPFHLAPRCGPSGLSGKQRRKTTMNWKHSERRRRELCDTR